MKKPILTYGVIAGLVIIVTMIVSIEVGHAAQWLGYLIMVIAFSTIFVAVRQYRNDTLGGVISFGTALLVGLGISVVAGVIYVAVWEVYLAATDFAFIDEYATSMIETGRQAGATEAELAKIVADSEEFKAQYANPMVRMPFTFLEIFPVGILVSLVSAAVLRNHTAASK